MSLSVGRSICEGDLRTVCKVTRAYEAFPIFSATHRQIRAVLVGVRFRVRPNADEPPSVGRSRIDEGHRARPSVRPFNITNLTRQGVLTRDLMQQLNGNCTPRIVD